MPGSHLNDTERRLMRLWTNENGAFSPFPTLREITIAGNPGLRGIKDLRVEFAYPLTVVCGRNGSGKSTILALSALGFHYDKPVSSSGDIAEPGYYTFSHFFYKGPGDPDITGLRITWRYGDCENARIGELTIQKRSEKWMHYERRPVRPTYYLGMQRCIPAIEQRVLRSHFGGQRKAELLKSLNGTYLGYLGHVLGRVYSEAEVMMSSRYSVRRCRSGSRYSSFNMGAGEDLLIKLLYILQNCPDGSLIVVEEIETGLFPEALVRLSETLQEIMYRKRLQVVVSTHSHYLIDSVPREARILLTRAGDEHTAISGPTTCLAMGDMAGKHEPELEVYCEDYFAELLVKQSLTGETRKRVRVKGVGSDSQLAPLAASLFRTGSNTRVLLVWDGDVPVNRAKDWLESAGFRAACGDYDDRLYYAFLPGDCPPEQWVVHELDCAQGYDVVSERFRIKRSEAQALIGELRATADSHDVGHAIERKWNIEQRDALLYLAECVARLPHDPLGSIRTKVEEALQGIPAKQATGSAAG
ncbi:MAG: ATP-dependent nuclease [Clostridia bacterium]